MSCSFCYNPSITLFPRTVWSLQACPIDEYRYILSGTIFSFGQSWSGFSVGMIFQELGINVFGSDYRKWSFWKWMMEAVKRTLNRELVLFVHPKAWLWNIAKLSLSSFFFTSYAKMWLLCFQFQVRVLGASKEIFSRKNVPLKNHHNKKEIQILLANLLKGDLQASK